jgi:hypothetical protein
VSRLLNKHGAERVPALEQHAHRQQLDEDLREALQIFVTLRSLDISVPCTLGGTTGTPTTTAGPVIDELFWSGRQRRRHTKTRARGGRAIARVMPMLIAIKKLGESLVSTADAPVPGDMG